jgi:hypothetical protein
MTQMKRALAIGLLWTAAAGAQCAMCYRTAQGLDSARGRALNSGILVLGMPPLLLLAGFAVLVIRRNR